MKDETHESSTDAPIDGEFVSSEHATPTRAVVGEVVDPSEGDTSRVTPVVAVASPPKPAVIAQALPKASTSTHPATRASSAGGHDLSVRLKSAISLAGPQALYQLTRIGPAGVAGVSATIAALIIAMTALVSGRNAIDGLTAQIARAQHSANPALTPQDGISHVVAALPKREEIPAVVGVVLQQAREAGVSLDKGVYTYSPARAGSVGRYELEFPVKAEYPNVRKFINLTLTAIPAASLEKLHIERKVVGDAVVNADVGFVVFVRNE